ncbi:SP-RING-type domain-containing protein [Psidium guajava]|nr:SP-RING-type domain-containing protein [Psidium guajava]
MIGVASKLLGPRAGLTRVVIINACAGDYQYLLSMAIGILTLEKVQKLCADKDKRVNEVDGLRKVTPQNLWLNDLIALEEKLDV